MIPVVFWKAVKNTSSASSSETILSSFGPEKPLFRQINSGFLGK
jgi:hypothetical protein